MWLHFLCEQEVTIEREALQTKLRRLEHEMEDIKSSGSHGDSELIQLRSQVHDLERKLTEAEDEICDLQQEAHDLEMVSIVAEWFKPVSYSYSDLQVSYSF